MRVIKNDLDRIKKHMSAPSEAANVRSSGSVVDQVVDLICNNSIDVAGIPIQFKKFCDSIRFRLGEVSLWSGYNGHGKSLILSQFALFACSYEKFLIISPEMPVSKTMQRMTHQATTLRHPTEQEIRKFHAWSDDKIWLYDQLGTVKTDVVFAVTRYAAQELGVTHVVIDSLMKCGIAFDDNNGQKRFIDNLCAMARDLNIHVHIVAHARKGQNEKGFPDKHDIKGVSELTDMVDNVFIHWRNKVKEQKIEKAKQVRDSVSLEELKTQPDAILACCKQRHGDWEGRIGLNFDLASQLYVHPSSPTPKRGRYDQV